ncbi:hypothetical protein D3C72_935340 [compost metagenome]
MSASATAITPTRSDTWVPKISRLNKSRPRSSVPSQWAPEGGFSRAPRACSVGLYGASHGASMAVNTKSTKITAPMTAPRFSEKRRQARLRRTVR